MSTAQPLPRFPDDDFEVTAAEPWFKVKVQVVQRYFHSFITKLAGRVDDIVVVDLFAGSGFYSAGYQKELIPTASFACLSLRLPVSRWVLCESEPNQFKALKVRVGKHFRDQPVLLQERAPDEMVEKLKLFVPASNTKHKVALLAILDPFSLDIPFSMIERLHGMGSSILLPYTFPLSDRFNHEHYCHQQKEQLISFLRAKDFPGEIQSNEQFYRKLIQTHQRNVLALGLSVSTTNHRLESQMMNIPTFAVSFFSGKIEAKTVQREYAGATATQFNLFA